MLRDWHPADVIAGLRKRGTNLSQLARKHGYTHPSTVRLALAKPFPKAERIIADALHVQPAVIWPSRYRDDGSPKSGWGERLADVIEYRPASATRQSQRQDAAKKSKSSA